VLTGKVTASYTAQLVVSSSGSVIVTVCVYRLRLLRGADILLFGNLLGTMPRNEAPQVVGPDRVLVLEVSSFGHPAPLA
jgi:hypothetical protein